MRGFLAFAVPDGVVPRLRGPRVKVGVPRPVSPDEALALAEPNVVFVGRLATYRYYNMDQVVGQALATYRRLAPRLMPAEAAE